MLTVFEQKPENGSQNSKANVNTDSSGSFNSGLFLARFEAACSCCWHCLMNHIKPNPQESDQATFKGIKCEVGRATLGQPH